MESSSNPISTSDEFPCFFDAPDDFYYDCLSIRCDSHRRYSSLSPPRRKWICSDVETEPSSSSNEFEVDGKSTYVEKSDEREVDFATNDKDTDGIESVRDQIDHLSPEKDNDLDEINNDVNDSGPYRVNPFNDENCMIGERTEESTVTTVSGDRGDDYAVSTPPELWEPNSTYWSLIRFLAGLVVKSIEFQVSLMIGFFTFPSWLLYCCSLFFFDPFSTIRLGRRYLTARVAWIIDLIFKTMNPFKLSWLKDTKQMLTTACKFAWGLFWAVYVGIVLFGLLVLSLMLGGYLINCIADEPFAVKESLNFDYTKNIPEAYVPITSCAGVACDGSCKESNEMQKIRGLRVIPRDHKLEITLSMTLPESSYNKNLGMFQVRVDFLSADGETLDSIRRPCMIRFRSEPIRFIQTIFKVVPLVTGYVSEIQTLNLKLTGLVEKDIPTACLKIMMEQRAEFRTGAGIPELYDASLSLESNLPFFKKIIWKWRKTLFVWISMSLFVTELLFALICCRPLIIPRTRLRDRSSPSNQTESR